VFPADTAADVAQTQYDPGRFGVALFDGRTLRLERSGLSNWRPVFQSIRMAISVHVRSLVVAWWIGTGDAIHSIAYRAGADATAMKKHNHSSDDHRIQYRGRYSRHSSGQALTNFASYRSTGATCLKLSRKTIEASMSSLVSLFSS
jgi:hypothetical protein